jgi:predicted RNA-binding protein Jag
MSMAYLRKEKEVVEMDFPAEKVWEAISEVMARLEWMVEEQDMETLKVTAKSKSGFMSYGSTISVEVSRVNENTTRVAAIAETPVTTVTSIVNFGQTARRVDSFFRELAAQLDTDSDIKVEGKKKKTQKK